MDLVHIAWAMDLAKKYSSARQMLAINVECVMVNIAKVQYDKLAKAAAELKYADGSPKLRLKRRNAATHDGDFRVRDAPPPVADAPTPQPVGPWRDAENPSADVVAKALLEDSGALLVGVGGTGNTHLVNEVIQQLHDLGHQVATVVYTHLAAQNMEGCTIHNFLHKHPAFSGILVIGESSFVPMALWNELARYQLSGAKFLVLGDFRGQTLPACNSGCGQEVSHDVEESVFVRSLCARTRV